MSTKSLRAVMCAHGFAATELLPVQITFRSMPVRVSGCLVISLFYNTAGNKGERLTFFTLLENKGDVLRSSLNYSSALRKRVAWWF